MVPVHRKSARVLPVDRDGHVLLLLGHDPARPEVPYWFTIGGGVEEGETVEEAAVRELHEETGIHVDKAQLVGPVHRGTHAFSFDGVDYVSNSTFFAVRVDDVTVHFDGLEEAEVGNVVDARWWDPTELGGGLSLSSLDLPTIAETAVAAVQPTSSEVDGPGRARSRTQGSKLFQELGRAFAAGGERYERLRPGYPGDAVSWMVEGTAAGGVVVDIGAGTGKLTTTLIDRGFDVVAVDPSADMLAQLSRSRPGATTQVGTGEATGLAENLANLVTFAQSWHWVDPAAGLNETTRVLKPGGRAAWVWSFMDVREPWVAELAAIWHTVGGDEATNPSRHTPVLDGRFGPVEQVTIDWAQPMPLIELAQLVTTRSYYLKASAAQREQIDAEVATFLDDHFRHLETIDLPYRTHCFKSALT